MGKMGNKNFDENGKLISADSFVFYRSWLDVVNLIERDDEKLEFLLSILRYGLCGTEPTNDCSSTVKVAFVQCKYLIDTQLQNYLNGNKGGRPKKKNEQNEGNEVGRFEKMYAPNQE